MVVATMRSPVVWVSTCSASRPPTSSPVSMRAPPPGSGTPTAHRSASGSLATIRSASVLAASTIARSIAPGSSGLGKATVGKSGSGSRCSSTVTGLSKPAAWKAAVRVAAPTPCSGV